MKKAFTLIELMIVICILAILTFVLFSAYNKISEISFRVEQERKVNEELLFLSEVLQNFANRNSIDFEKYNNTLISSSGFSDTLYLSWDDGKFSIYASWECAPYSIEPNADQFDSWCFFYLQNDEINDGNPIKLTNESVYFSQAKFKIIPYSDNYFAAENAAICENYFACVNDDWFWLFTDIYPRFYSSQIRSNNVHVLVQHFFNI